MGFPEGYRETFKQFFVFDRLDTKSVQYVCGNDAAVSVKPGEPLPYGSILVFETWRPKQDPSGKPILDEKGHMVRQMLNAIFVMRKEKGFGKAYESLRNGEWEYVAYRSDKSYLIPPQNTANCASCHLAGVGQANDFVFRLPLFFSKDHYAQSPVPGPNEAQMSRMAFFPNALTVKAGTTVTWKNALVDGIDHTVTSKDNLFDSGVLKPGANSTHTFNTAGTFQYFCSLHPEQMQARVVVTQ